MRVLTLTLGVPADDLTEAIQKGHRGFLGMLIRDGYYIDVDGQVAEVDIDLDGNIAEIRELSEAEQEELLRNNSR